MRNQELVEMNEKFQNYLFGIDDSLVELESFLKSVTGIEGKVLDKTPESLDIVETVLAKVLDGDVKIDVPLDVLITRISTYIGEILRKKRNGRWSLCLEKNIDFGYPQIVELEGLNEKYGWCPMALVSNFIDNRKNNALKNATFNMVKYRLGV